jgi:hypothetical protein
MSLRVGRGPEYDIDLDGPLSEQDRQYLADRDPVYRDILGTSELPAAEGPLPDTYEEWTVPQLQNELAARELPTRANKPELIARLAESDR